MTPRHWQTVSGTPITSSGSKGPPTHATLARGVAVLAAVPQSLTAHLECDFVTSQEHLLEYASDSPSLHTTGAVVPRCPCSPLCCIKYKPLALDRSA